MRKGCVSAGTFKDRSSCRKELSSGGSEALSKSCRKDVFSAGTLKDMSCGKDVFSVGAFKNKSSHAGRKCLAGGPSRMQEGCV